MKTIINSALIALVCMITFNGYSQCACENDAQCLYHIAINKDSLPSNRFSEYLLNGIVAYSSNDRVYIDLSKIADSIDTKEVAEWLEENGDYINHEESNNCIINLHEIGTINDNPAIEAEINFDNIKRFVGAKFDDDHYDKYVEFNIVKGENNRYNVAMTLHDDFVENGRCFSIPFLRSVVRNLEENPTLTFKIGKIDTDHTGIYFTLNGNNYNYTRIPTKKKIK